METKGTQLASKAPVAAVVGLSALVIATVIYAYEQGFMTFVTPERAAYFGWVAEAYIMVLFAAVALVALDLWRMLDNRVRTARQQGFAPLSPGWLVPYVLSVKRYRRYFVASAILYGLFYAVITSMVVYQPTVDFVQAYGATFPSALLTPCCGAPLYSPIITVYVANHLGLLLIPLTVILLVTISTLVGLNLALAAFAFDSRAKGASKTWIGGLGAVVGLFTGCPTCAGLFFANILGGAGAVSFATVLTDYQPAFIAISIPVLVATPYLISRSLSKVFRDGCVVLQLRSSA